MYDADGSDSGQAKAFAVLDIGLALTHTRAAAMQALARSLNVGTLAPRSALMNGGVAPADRLAVLHLRYEGADYGTVR